MLALLLPLLASAADPPWLASCTGQGVPSRAKVTCSGGDLLVTIEDAPLYDPVELVASHAKNLAEHLPAQMTAEGSRVVSIDGVPAARLDVYREAPAVVIALMGAGPRPGGSRVATCVNPSGDEAISLSVCGPALAWFVSHGTQGVSLVAETPAVPLVRSLMKTPMPDLTGCEISDLPGRFEARCPDGELTLFANRPSKAAAGGAIEVASVMKAILGLGKQTVEGEAPCATLGTAQVCHTLVVRYEMGDQHAVVAPISKEVIAVCSWWTDVPAQCTAMFTTMPAMPK